ncbi:MAG TPA: GNAT family N-acetyltransferase [Puia sp.]|nr:GNAT family N-acetyltransferase [Puia sp.]
MTIFAETPRTILREISMDDVDPFFEMDSDPEVHKYLGTRPVENRDQIIETIHYVKQQYIDNGIGRWAIAEKSTNRFIGWTGLKLVKDLINNQTDYYDLGYRLIRKLWGQGYATETARASLLYGFDKLNLNEIIATVNCDNAASKKIVEKLGFTLCETFYLHELKHDWYKISKNHWTDVLNNKIHLYDNTGRK